MVSAWPAPTVPSPAGVVAAGVVTGVVGIAVSSPPPPHPAERAKIKARNSPTLAGKLLTPFPRINVSPAICRTFFSPNTLTLYRFWVTVGHRMGYRNEEGLALSRRLHLLHARRLLLCGG